jgi:hypothetical protein
MHMMLLSTLGTGHCSCWLDAVYRMPGSASVRTVQHGAGPPSCSHLLFNEPHSLGPCPVMDCDRMFDRIRRSVLQMHCATHCCHTALNTNRKGLCSFWEVMQYKFYFRCRTVGWQSVSERSCSDRLPRHGFFLVSLYLKANAETVPNTPSCHYMLLMWPSGSKLSSNCVHVNWPLPPGDNPIAVNKYYYYYYYYYHYLLYAGYLHIYSWDKPCH